jgi:hypothetical protein
VSNASATSNEKVKSNVLRKLFLKYQPKASERREERSVCLFFSLKRSAIGMTVQKLYFPISSTIKRVQIEKEDEKIKRLSIDLPDAFVAASGPKFIYVRHVRVLHHRNIAHDIKLHGSVVSFNPFDDSYVCFCNETLTKPKKYAYTKNSRTLDFWFRDMYGENVYVDSFVIETMLEWTTPPQGNAPERNAPQG